MGDGDARTATRSRTARGRGRPRVRRRRAHRVARGRVRRPAIGQQIRLALDAPITTDHVNLVQPLLGRAATGSSPRWSCVSTAATTVAVALGRVVADGGGADRHLSDAATFQTLEIEITDLNVGAIRLHGHAERGRLRGDPPARRRRERTTSGSTKSCRCRATCSTRSGRDRQDASARPRDEPRRGRADPAAARSRARRSRVSSRSRARASFALTGTARIASPRRESAAVERALGAADVSVRRERDRCRTAWRAGADGGDRR